MLTTGEYNYILITIIIAEKLTYIVGSKFSGFPENCQTTKLTPSPHTHTKFSHYMAVTIIIYASMQLHHIIFVYAAGMNRAIILCICMNVLSADCYRYACMRRLINACIAVTYSYGIMYTCT